MTRPSFQEIYMGMAKLMAQRSTCTRLQVGTVITSTDYRKVLSVGYNGNASGFPNTCDRTGEEAVGNCGCLHAEENAAISCDVPRSTPKIVFCTHLPCPMCAKRLVNLGGVQLIYYATDYRKTESLEIFTTSGIEVVRQDNMEGLGRTPGTNTTVEPAAALSPDERAQERCVRCGVEMDMTTAMAKKLDADGCMLCSACFLARELERVPTPAREHSAPALHVDMYGLPIKVGDKLCHTNPQGPPSEFPVEGISADGLFCAPALWLTQEAINAQGWWLAPAQPQPPRAPSCRICEYHGVPESGCPHTGRTAAPEPETGKGQAKRVLRLATTMPAADIAYNEQLPIEQARTVRNKFESAGIPLDKMPPPLRRLFGEPEPEQHPATVAALRKADENG